MKICYIISDIDKAIFFENTALALRDEGFDVCYIIINCENGALIRFLKENNFSYYYLSSAKLSQSIPQIFTVRKILRKEKVTLVHCHLAQANWIGLWSAYLNKIPERIYTRHSGEPLKLMWKERIIDFFQNRLATKIVSISQVIDHLLEKQNVPSYKREVIHHGFELDRFIENDWNEVARIKNEYNPNNQYPVIGVIARWMKWKGIQNVIEGFQLVLKTHPDALLCLFGASGAGDYHESISELLHRIPAKNVRIIAFENNVFDLYQLLDVYVHTPVNPTCEAFGQTYVEGLAAKIPSVFTPSGIAQEFVIHKKHALLVPFENPPSIAAAILEILSNPEQAGKMSTSGREIVKELFDFSVYQRNLVNFYNSCKVELSKPKIIYVVSDVNRAVYFEQAAMALRKSNYEVIFVLISCRNSPMDNFLKTNGFKRYYLDTGKLIRSSGTIWRLRKIFKQEKPQWVHTHLSKANWVGLNAAWLAGVKNRLYTRHSGKPILKNRKESIIDSFQNRIATKIIAISDNISELLDEQKVAPRKQMLINHGFDLDRFVNNDQKEVKRMIQSYNPEGKKPVIGVISRWMELKGIHYIINAFLRLLDDYPDALLCLFGGGINDTYSIQLRKQIALIPEKNLCLISFENNCFDLYQLFDIHIHVPINETCEAFGQTYVEALAAGVPSVFTKSGVAREFIQHEYNALVVPFKNEDEIYNACIRLLADPELRNQLIKNGKKSVESFNFEDHIKNLINVYNS